MEIVRWLATKGGGDPTIPTVQGMAPLHVATMAGQLEAVKYLYQFGSATAFGGLRSSDGSSALHFAAASGESQLHIGCMSLPLCNVECSFLFARDSDAKGMLYNFIIAVALCVSLSTST